MRTGTVRGQLVDAFRNSWESRSARSLSLEYSLETARNVLRKERVRIGDVFSARLWILHLYTEAQEHVHNVWNKMSPTRMSEFSSITLPPRTMSENEVNEFWCLIDDEETPFSVNVSRRWDVEELTKTIRQARPRLQTIDIIDIVLWKVRLSYSLASTFVPTCVHSWMIPCQSNLPWLLPNVFHPLSLISASHWMSRRILYPTSFYILPRTIFISSWNCQVSEYMVICVWETDYLSVVPDFSEYRSYCSPSKFADQRPYKKRRVGPPEDQSEGKFLIFIWFPIVWQWNYQRRPQ